MNKENLKIGARVSVPAKWNSTWAGVGIVEFIGENYANLKMVTGGMAGITGGFKISALEGEMQILKIKRSEQRTGLKIYGKLLSTSGETYNFAYIRRPNFRGWICSCENFFFTMFKKNRNCKHLKFVREQVGRYGAKAGV